MSMLARPARGRARGDAARGPGVSPHVAIRRTRQGRGDNPFKSFIYSQIDSNVSAIVGRCGASEALHRVTAQAAPFQSRRRTACIIDF